MDGREYGWPRGLAQVDSGTRLETYGDDQNLLVTIALPGK
jgi:hypothetical protein